ncbi:MAG: TrkA-related ion transporter [Spirochaetia bacterium]
MKKKLKKMLNLFSGSRYAKLFVYFIIFFILSGVIIVIFELRVNEQFTDVMDGLWWSIITVSTTGYGDKVPVTLGGRILAVVSIIAGVGAMSLLSGALASLLVDRNTKARRGLMDYKKVKEHIIICGWKEDMKDILMDILRVSGDIESDGIIIVSNVESAKIEALQEEPLLKGLRYVRGDYFSEMALERANVRTARKVLILADVLESSAASEVDSKTVMTVLTVKALAKDVYVYAEILDRKYESYLKQAMCDEIMYSRDLSRRMLANSSATSGMSHIIRELLSHESSDTYLKTLNIPAEFIDKPFTDFQQQFSDFKHRIVLGVLENTGSPNKMKIEALRNAQKTSDVSQLVNNLQKVKGLEVNKPIFLPSAEYTIQRHTQAIVLERR